MPSTGEGKLFRVALGHLKYRPRTEQEVRERLRRAGASPEDQESLILRLRALGLVDDGAFARFWRQSREAGSPRSRRLLERELRHKGVPPQEIADALAGLSDEEMAERAARARQRHLAAQDFPSFTTNLGGYLRRRGFSFELCHRLTRQLWQERHPEAASPTNNGSQPGAERPGGPE